MVRGGRAEAPVPRSDVSFRLDQKTGNVKAAIPSREMQWGALTEEKQKNELAQTELHKNNSNVRRGNYMLAFASISALHCRKRRHISRLPLMADQCRGVRPLKKSMGINLLHENDENK